MIILFTAKNNYEIRLLDFTIRNTIFETMLIAKVCARVD